MLRVFADTNYWSAILHPRDQLHGVAVALRRKLAGAHVVTTEMVLVELLNQFSAAGPHFRRAAAETVETLRADASVTILPQTAERFDRALRRYAQSWDKGWSLTDCASFDVMEEEGIRAALTYDEHFEQAGFEALLR